MIAKEENITRSQINIPELGTFIVDVPLTVKRESSQVDKTSGVPPHMQNLYNPSLWGGKIPGKLK